MLRPTLAVLAACCCSACAGALQPDPVATVSTDRTAYTAEHIGPASDGTYGFVLITRFTNPTDSALYLGRCTPSSTGPVYGIEMRVAGAPNGYAGAWACVGHDAQFAVLPGATRIDTLHVRGPNMWEGGQPIGLLAGTMRLRYEVQGCRGDGACRMAELGLSNDFTVITAP